MISSRYSCIFVHIPKTGGTSIEDIIWPNNKDRTEENLWMGFIDKYHNRYQTGGLQHLLASQIKLEVTSGQWNDYFKFSVIRNPFDKCVSQFVYMQRREDLRRFIGMKIDDSFSKYLDLIAKHNHVQWESQYKFLFDECGTLMVDFVGRFETFEKDVKFILKSLGIVRGPFASVPIIPHKKKSKRESYQYYYGEIEYEKVWTMYRKDIETFGYQF